MTKAQKLLEADGCKQTEGSMRNDFKGIAYHNKDLELIDLADVDAYEISEMVSDDGKTPNYFLNLQNSFPELPNFLVFSNKPIDKAAAKEFFNRRWKKI